MSNRHAVVLAAFLMALSAIAHAQSRQSLPGGYPNKPIRIIVGAAPGGGADIQARIVAPRLTDRWKNPVVVVNQPSGVGGVIGMEGVAKSAPDGYTLMLAASSSVLKPPWSPRPRWMCAGISFPSHN